MRIPAIIDGTIKIEGDTVICTFPDGVQMIFDDDHTEDALPYLSFRHKKVSIDNYQTEKLIEPTRDAD